MSSPNRGPSSLLVPHPGSLLTTLLAAYCCPTVLLGKSGYGPLQRPHPTKHCCTSPMPASPGPCPHAEPGPVALTGHALHWPPACATCPEGLGRQWGGAGLTAGSCLGMGRGTCLEQKRQAFLRLPGGSQGTLTRWGNPHSPSDYEAAARPCLATTQGQPAPAGLPAPAGQETGAASRTRGRHRCDV